MAREIDLDNLDKDDLEYLSQREGLIREAEVLGYKDIRARIKNRDSEEQTDNKEVGIEELEGKLVSEMSTDELKAALKEHGLPTSGKKDELVARLEEALDDEVEEEDDED